MWLTQHLAYHYVTGYRFMVPCHLLLFLSPVQSSQMSHQHIAHSEKHNCCQWMISSTEPSLGTLIPLL